jgi:hypothetical protein
MSDKDIWGHTIGRMMGVLKLRLRNLASLLHMGSLGASLPPCSIVFTYSTVRF